MATQVLVFTAEEQKVTDLESMILVAYPNLTLSQLRTLTEVTSKVTGVSFVSINGYKSDASGNTETANHVINVGASYANMLKKDTQIYANVDLSAIDVTLFNYKTVDYSPYGSLQNFQTEVKNSLQTALEELRAPKKSKDMSSYIRLNAMLSFNTNTKNLLISGMEIGEKKIVNEGDFKVVKSSPKTIAKKIIEKFCKPRTASLRTFKIDNTSNFKVMGDTFIIE